MKSDLGQAEKIILTMIRRYGKQTYFYAYDFMPPRMSMDDECFVGYEASARMSELARDYPDLIESGKDGKYRTLRFRFENVGVALTKLPEITANWLIDEMLKAGVKRG